MIQLDKNAALIRNILIAQNLENPFQNHKLKINTIKRKFLIKKYIKKILQLLNLNLKNDSISKTPDRIVNMYFNETFFGLNYYNFPKINTIKNTINFDEMILKKNITLTSTCEHHFLIFDGKANIAYIPKNKIIGLSTLHHIVRFFSARPQIQERLTKQISLTLETLLETQDVAVSINAIHYCIKARNFSCDNENNVTTFSLGGIFKKNKNIRKEFLLNSYKII